MLITWLKYQNIKIFKMLHLRLKLLLFFSRQSTHPTFPEASLDHPWYPQPWRHCKPSTTAKSRGSPRCLPPPPAPTLSLYSTVLLPVIMATTQLFSAGQQDRQVDLALYFFCWLHGWNISHNSPDCRVMASNPQYTAVMRTATDPEGNGGNPT
jgi:hypothetical protein